MKKKEKKKKKEKILGQHEGDLNVSIPCIIPKNKIQEKMIVTERIMKEKIEKCTKRERRTSNTHHGGAHHAHEKERKK
jgi:hypothetical protein